MIQWLQQIAESIFPYLYIQQVRVIYFLHQIIGGDSHLNFSYISVQIYSE